jgi:hypothetical protein
MISEGLQNMHNKLVIRLKHTIASEQKHPNYEFISGLLDNLYIEIQKMPVNDVAIRNIMEELTVFNVFKNTVHSLELKSLIFDINFWLDII